MGLMCLLKHARNWQSLSVVDCVDAILSYIHIYIYIYIYIYTFEIFLSIVVMWGTICSSICFGWGYEILNSPDTLWDLPLWLGTQLRNPRFLAYLILSDHQSSSNPSEISSSTRLIYFDQLHHHLGTTFCCFHGPVKIHLA